jgi:deoxycytidylate deaminase
MKIRGDFAPPCANCSKRIIRVKFQKTIGKTQINSNCQIAISKNKSLPKLTAGSVQRKVIEKD